MRNMKYGFGAIVLALAVGTSGCNFRSGTPWDQWYTPWKPKSTLKVDPANAGELEAVSQVESARLSYRFHLSNLLAYYKDLGDATRLRWATRELENLDKCQEFRFEGIGQVNSPHPVATGTTDLHGLVETLVAHRQLYRKRVDILAQFYETSGLTEKAHLVHTMQSRFWPERTYMYILSAELPSKDLLPRDIIPEANDIFHQAEAMYRSASRVPGMASFPKQRQALQMFKGLIKQYPTSTYIPLSAFYVAEIYKEYFSEHYLAALWYELAWTWDPYIAKPIRFQCALQHDIHLAQKEKALQLYKASVEFEAVYRNNVRYCYQRIGELEALKRKRGYLDKPILTIEPTPPETAPETTPDPDPPLYDPEAPGPP